MMTTGYISGKNFLNHLVDDILIKPSWEELDPFTSAEMVIEIDPGTSLNRTA